MIKVAIVDDHSLMREGIRNVLRIHKNIQVILEAANGKILIDLLKSGNLPHIVLLDIQMPEMDGYQTLSYLKDHYPSIKVIMLSMIYDDFVVSNLMQCGASAFISKNIEPTTLVETIERTYLNDEKHKKGATKAPIPDKEGKESMPLLTDKELELLKYSSTHLTYNQIAALMLMSPKTLEHYRISLFKKMKIQTRSELAALSVRMGFGKTSF